MVPDEPYTPAELEAAASAIGTARHVIASDGYPSIRIGTDEEEARFALDAAAPLIDARVRAEERARVAEEIAADIADNPGPNPSPAIPAWWAGWVEGRNDAAAIARAHATPQEEQRAEPVD